ncbi:DNA helicase-2 / ATP-dependent DNA helicase PcrA [Fontibacillus panacisegetis]|uniref:DNA helicase-2 / ATP-dependent DNA helicase PcrA n=1 Tax=Fontibacillus panacisegetis TaxID=670482 RepID=A0A1G7Q7R6_9BACL|nr:ATP-binding domain-containing protein [Fontibacillus panacisegetis]SDF94534.1 DNA helicase-2 / ATP-dependent DNA helicase PcrA [Fontibacillus panacisegetis]
MEQFQSAYQEEKERLDRTLETIDRKLEQLRSIPVYTGHDFTEQLLEENREMQRQQLEQSHREPYFGRLDFEEQGKSMSPLYIGKVGVSGDDVREPIVIDWRAPVASLFYSFTGGDHAEYEAPEGLIEGLVYLKRNIVIRKGILERVVDTFNKDSDGPAVSDEFLVYRLGENKDNRLRDIVSTIQAEQDKIIRAAKNTALIIQGVAGSGKTTVALHRLAFLLYQYKEQIKAERMVIFAPNLMFIDYISEVLPELGVGDIMQSTFSHWALQILGIHNDGLLVSDTDSLVRWFDSSEKGNEALEDSLLPGRYKGSLEFKSVLDEYLEHIAPNIVPVIDFEPWEGKRLPYKMIEQWFEDEYRHYKVAERKERVLARIHRWIEMELKKSPSAAVMKERKKKAQQREKAYAKKWPELEALALYRSLFIPSKAESQEIQAITDKIPKGIFKETQAYLKKGMLHEEDMAALLYIYSGIQEINGNLTFDHVVIDEAQDFSPFQVAVLDRFVRGHSFTILGDLSQGIHYYKGVRKWEEMQTLFDPEETAYFALTRSYRSTMEIIDFANEILKRGVGSELLAVPVFRSGDPVRLEPAYGNDRLRIISATLEQASSHDYRTVALLTRTLHEAELLHTYLLEKSVEAHLINGDKTQYEGGISVLPVYLSKGLEFDAVIVTDVDQDHYGPSDAKLLYVGCTRALHELWLLHGEKLPDYVVATS